ncbi:hypothetical protein [Streptomyces sp. NPDC088739]|uniref:hypothetical protein n=1 Tax=Streptomyces sp. NPDC088739 TaxID=3365882 RepID=UPI0037F91F33
MSAPDTNTDPAEIRNAVATLLRTVALRVELLPAGSFDPAAKGIERQGARVLSALLLPLGDIVMGLSQATTDPTKAERVISDAVHRLAHDHYLAHVRVCPGAPEEGHHDD